MKTICPIYLALTLFIIVGAPPTWAAGSYTLTVTADHGSVTIEPDKPSYDDGETVTLIPRPDVGHLDTPHRHPRTGIRHL